MCDGLGRSSSQQVAGVVLLAVAGVSLVEAFRIRDDWPGARLLPALVGGILLALAVAHLLRPPGTPAAWPDGPRARRVALVAGLLVLYGLGLPALGFLTATALFVLVLLRLLGTLSWTASIALTVVLALSCHLVFTRWLGMPLPAGPLAP